ncbi:MAG: FHIPEP family type III secretion protein [Phycisphaeraceae bacterium]|nr:FHIPEP family type III secretion protein [Phycisphaerales bacterium]MCB9842949.1 FHIPEP family type III secretion protein [Phycisphaeraceae bacterium]
MAKGTVPSLPSRRGEAPAWAKFIAHHRSLIAPLAFVLMIGVILVQMPPMVMDVLIAVNICIAVVMLLTTMYIEEPLDLSVFPSLLLGTTMLRLVLNIASTRLILTADAPTAEEAVGVAGKVISAFGSFVAGGSLAVGIIIFLILVIVQFVVITKGATRISEVAARFTLDAMPGRQMAIDADLNAGIIDEREARRRRERIAEEADFFGAMDGASKFVRGDAVAGIIITVVNVIGGFAVGMLEKDWGVGETAKIFTILTIGDGLASQIPGFIIALASALVVTRSSSKGTLGSEVAGQLASRPVALFITSGFIGLLAFTPLPSLPLLTLAAIIGAIAFFTVKQERITKEDQQLAEVKERQAEATKAPPVEDLLKVDTLELEVGYGLVSLVDTAQGGDLLDRIAAIRRQLATEIGLVLPPVRVRDNMLLQPNDYRIKIRGNIVAEGQTIPGRLMAMDSGIASGRIHGQPTIEPAFGLQAWWIEPSLKTRAESMNYTVVDPTSVLTTHLGEVVKAHADELLTREEVGNLIEQLKQAAPKLVEQTIPAIVQPGDLQKILQALLRERVSIRDLESIVEALAEWAPRTKDHDVLVEYARNALRRSICQSFATPIDQGHAGGGVGSGGVGGTGGRKWRIVCVTMDPAFEDLINSFVDRSPAGTTLTMPARIASAVAKTIRKSLEPVIAAGHQPVVIASPTVRSIVRQILEPYISGVAVLGYNEIVSGVDVESMALVTLPEELEAAPVGV